MKHWKSQMFSDFDEKYMNKNDKILKSKAKEIRWSLTIDKYRVAANITEYHIVSK